MDQSERLRYLQKTTRYISQSKCVDASLRTLIVQSAASKMAAPSSVSLNGNPAAAYAAIAPVAIPGPSIIRSSCGVAKGKGTNGEYIAILQAKQGCAICSDSVSPSGGITVPAPCVDMNAPPFTQQNMSDPYKSSCGTPSEVYFPPKIYDGPNCTYTRITTPSG
jgi:hypothetical protein